MLYDVRGKSWAGMLDSKFEIQPCRDVSFSSKEDPFSDNGKLSYSHHGLCQLEDVTDMEDDVRRVRIMGIFGKSGDLYPKHPPIGLPCSREVFHGCRRSPLLV